MKPARPPRWLLKVFLVVNSILFLAPGYLRAQQPASCQDWTAVQSWTGTITVSGSGTSTSRGNTYTISEQATISFTSATPDPVEFGPCGTSFPSTNQWFVSGSPVASSVTIHDQIVGPAGSCTVNIDVANGTTSTGSARVILNFTNSTTGTYNISFPTGVDSGVVYSYSGNGCPGSSTGGITWGPFGSPYAGFLSKNIPLPSNISTLSGSSTIQGYDQAVGGNGTGQGTWTVTWNISPTLPDLDVLITIPGYSTWRPMAGMNESAVGNFLIVQGQLISKNTGQPVAISADQWTFTLKGTSSEPGVTLNWPPQNQLANPTPLDLDFNDPINKLLYPNITVSNPAPDTTMAQILPDPANPNCLPVAQLVVDSHDWGGWATLNVSAVVPGQTTPIQGHMQLSSSQNITDVPLPQRQPGSHVADAWKLAHNVALSTLDSDDSEPNPAGYPGCLGDGFTLYEEYRGFMENGKHIEGDPNSKDFFVENLIGAAAEPGIWRFTQLTGLTVHKNIQKNETKIDHPNGAFGSILINFNYSEGAHATNQHGVTIVSQNYFPGSSYSPLSGGITIGNEAGVHFKPRLVDGIAIQYKNQPGTLNPNNTHLGVITPTSATLQYDVGVAHELMHPVGVDHHGDVDARLHQFILVPPGSPGNATSQAVFQLQGQNVKLTDEATGLQDAASLLWGNYQAIYSQCKAVLSFSVLFPSSVVNYCNSIQNYLPLLLSPTLYIGSPHGQHSGNDQCVMRYFLANTYPSAANNSLYYLVPAGTEPLGNSLCNTAAGTGVNDPKRTPQPRYFDASPGRGGCQFWICVSDNPNYPLVPN